MTPMNFQSQVQLTYNRSCCENIHGACGPLCKVVKVQSREGSTGHLVNPTVADPWFPWFKIIHCVDHFDHGTFIFKVFFGFQRALCALFVSENSRDRGIFRICRFLHGATPAVARGTPGRRSAPEAAAVSSRHPPAKTLEMELTTDKFIDKGW